MDGYPIQGTGVRLVNTSEIRDGARAIVLYMDQLPTAYIPTEAGPSLLPSPLRFLLHQGWDSGPHACLASLLSLLCLLRERKEPIGEAKLWSLPSLHIRVSRSTKMKTGKNMTWDTVGRKLGQEGLEV